MRGLKLVKTLDVVTITSQIIGANIQPSMVFMINQRMKTAVIDHYAVSNHNWLTTNFTNVMHVPMYLLAENCTGAKMGAGYCVPQFNNVSCYVERGECYCDPICLLNGDCCDDAKSK